MFDLPVITGIAVQSSATQALLSWQPIIMPTRLPTEVCFQGYAVYRITRAGIISKNPLNKHPLQVTQYQDCFDSNVRPKGYMVRALFGKDKKTFSGPTSRLIRL